MGGNGAGSAVPAVDILVCDLDGVLRRFDSRVHRAIEQRHDLAAGTIEAVAFNAPELQEALRGRIRDDAWRDAVREQLIAAHGDRAGVALDEWSAYIGVIDTNILNLLQQVRRRVPIVVLTNATSRLQTDLAAVDLAADAVDAVVSSAQVGAAKPEAEAYLAAARVGLRHAPPLAGEPRVAFVDDSPGHVAAAEGLGWSCHAYVGPSEMTAWLHELRLLPAG